MKSGKEQIRLSLRLRQADSRLQAAHQRHGISLVPDIVVDHRSVQIHLVAGRENRAEVEAIRQHANHGDRCPVQVDSLAHDAAIAGILPLPERMTEQHHRTAVVQTFLGREEPPQRWLHAQRLKEISATIKPGNRRWAVRCPSA